MSIRSGYLPYIAVILLVAAVWVAYWQSLGHGFVFDDHPYIVEHEIVREGISLEGVKWAFTEVHGANWHPLNTLSHMLDCQIFGLNPKGHHLVNIIFHTLNTILLLFVLMRMTGSFWKSAFVAALFALHPLHVESVAWIAERKDVLSAFFWLLTMWAYFRYVKIPGVGRYLLVMGFFAFGLMSKPMLVSLPIVLLMLDFWPLRRFSMLSEKKRGFIHAAKTLAIEKIPLFALTIISSALTIFAQQKGGAVVQMEQYTFGIRAANAIVSYSAYLAKMVWPSGLAAYYPHPLDTLPAWQIFGSIVFLTGITFLAVKYRKTHPYFLMGWLWYVITLMPVIGLVQVGEQAMADRYTYIPLIGIFAMIAWGMPTLKISQIPVVANRLIPVCATVLIIACAIGTWMQVRYWESDKTLFQRAVDVTEKNWMAHNNLGAELHKEGKIEEAIEHYQKSIAANPRYADSNYNLASALSEIGEVDKASDYFRKALEINPNHNPAKIGLANVISETNHLDQGIELAKQGKIDEAIYHFRETLKLDSNSAEAHNNLGIALAMKGDIERAKLHFNRSLRINPEYAEAHYNMGMVAANQGKTAEAIDRFSEAIRLKPDYADAHINLAINYFTIERFEDAWRHIHLSRQHGGNPHPGFLEALSQRLPDPGQ